jgi:predicted house-cleaning noncanonical NTP pyrophosphatase (MazG superfamily)
MTKKVYNKLVRDKIPEIIEAEGKTVKSRWLSKEEYFEELIKKLGEEYEEFKEARNLEELVDLQEVILALADAMNIKHGALGKALSEKALQKGAFKHRVYLESVEN